ncbi:hypothetical protein DPEC_G00270110 [Dallia pectoralis]|uniref:Uncharacterized protein n=1 Tax=Dallia pectoralis TaxID=75939 RepID=A0ACC2FPK8_DALPE|nr:hypothetical protein DPEC_G00270110 [Dallia pectoralis]
MLLDPSGPAGLCVGLTCPALTFKTPRSSGQDWAGPCLGLDQSFRVHHRPAGSSCISVWIHCCVVGGGGRVGPVVAKTARGEAKEANRIRATGFCWLG